MIKNIEFEFVEQLLLAPFFSKTEQVFKINIWYFFISAKIILIEKFELTVRIIATIAHHSIRHIE